MNAIVREQTSVSSLQEPIDLSLQKQVEDFYYDYASTIADNQIEKWPDYFEEACFYQVIPRANYERGLPVAPLFCESRGSLIDRVTAIRSTLVYAPRSITHQVTNIRVTKGQDGILQGRSVVTVYQTMVEGETRLLLVARTIDAMRATGKTLKFVRRDVIYDTELLASALIYPV